MDKADLTLLLIEIQKVSRLWKCCLGFFKTFSGSKVQLVEFLYEIADTFPLYSIQLSGTNGQTADDLY